MFVEIKSILLLNSVLSLTL